MTLRTYVCLLAAAGLIAVAAAAAASPPALTLEFIMRDPDWIGNAPTRPYWSDDAGAVYYWQKATGSDMRELFRVDLVGGAAVRIDAADRANAGGPASDYSDDRRWMVFERHGDLFLLDRPAGDTRQLTRTAAHERAPRFMAGDRRIQFVRDGVILVRDLDTGLEFQPAVLVADAPPEEKDAERKLDYLQGQQERLFDHVARRRERRTAAREQEAALRRGDPSRLAPPCYLGANLRIHRTSLSPSGRWMLVVTTPPKREEGKRDSMPAYVNDSGYVTTQNVREKVGTGKPWPMSLQLLDVDTGEHYPIDLSTLPGISDDPLAALRQEAGKSPPDAVTPAAPAAEPEPAAQSLDERDDAEGQASEQTRGEAMDRPPPVTERAALEADSDAPESPANPKEANGEAGTPVATPGAAKPRPVEIATIRWNRAGTGAVFQCFSHDNKDRWIVAIDLEAHAARAVARQSDEAWINRGFCQLAWLNRRNAIYFVSERDGYAHAYLHDFDSDQRRQLTSGVFEVSSPTLTDDDRYLYFRANRFHPGVYEIYRVATATGEWEQITRLQGDCEYILSPDESTLLLTWSDATSPPELYVQEATPGAPARRLTDTVSEEFETIPWVHPKLVSIPSSTGGQIHARLYDDADTHGAAKAPPRPAVLFIHGAGYLQNAYEGWSYYFREFMFHSLLVERGYVVLDLDYRASAGYGRDWRTAIYRQMGTPELEDLRDGVDYLVRERNVDRRRVGVYGGSYGGFLTLMALFKEPDLFACGAALRPVTDWAHYNDGYTSNILNTPEVDPQAYEASSPMEFAAGLRRPLLMCHGMLDGNVLVQDTVRLAQRLIELQKEDWEMALYPVEGHGFESPSSWLDEYRRIFKLFEVHLRDRAAAGADR